MKHTGWTVGDIARIADVTSSAVSQWVGHGEGKRSKSIGNIEAAMKLERKSGFSALWLAKGRGPKLSDSDSVHSGDANKEKHSGNIDEVEMVSENGSDPSQSIPTSMPYEPRHLKSAILLMGSLLGALDSRSKRMIGELLKELAEDTDDAQDIAEKASVLATVQKPITKNKALNKAIRGRGDSVETGPVPLEHK